MIGLPKSYYQIHEPELGTEVLATFYKICYTKVNKLNTNQDSGEKLAHLTTQDRMLYVGRLITCQPMKRIMLTVLQFTLSLQVITYALYYVIFYETNNQLRILIHKSWCYIIQHRRSRALLMLS